VTFIVDRLGRVKEGLSCGPLPSGLGYAGLTVYMVHPTLMQILLQYFEGLRAGQVGVLWVTIIAIVFTPFLISDLVKEGLVVE